MQGLDLRLLAPWSLWPVLSGGGRHGGLEVLPVLPGHPVSPPTSFWADVTGHRPPSWEVAGARPPVHRGLPSGGLAGSAPWEEEGLPWTGLLLSLSGSSEDPLLA